MNQLLDRLSTDIANVEEIWQRYRSGETVEIWLQLKLRGPCNCMMRGEQEK